MIILNEQLVDNFCDTMENKFNLHLFQKIMLKKMINDMLIKDFRILIRPRCAGYYHYMNQCFHLLNYCLKLGIVNTTNLNGKMYPTNFKYPAIILTNKVSKDYVYHYPYKINYERKV